MDGFIKIKAAVIRETSGPFIIEDGYIQQPRNDEILVKIVASGVCHTDLYSRDSETTPKPVVLGHEGTGIVEAVGGSVKSVKKGDHVMMNYYSCGLCNNCAEGYPYYCYKHVESNFGCKRLDDGSTTHLTHDKQKMYGCYFRQSSFSTYAICTERNCVVADKNLDLRQLAPLCCGVQTGSGAVINTLKCEAGSDIAIFGTGGVGLSAIMAAKLVGCSKIIAIDINESRLELAKRFGATHTLNGKDENLQSKLIDLTNGGLKYALDTTGNVLVLKTAFQSLKPTGIVGLIGGSKQGAEVSIDMGLLLRGRTVRGVIQGDAIPKVFIPKLIDLWRQGKFPFDELSKFYSFDEINKAVEDSLSGKTIKPILIIDESYKPPESQ